MKNLITQIIKNFQIRDDLIEKISNNEELLHLLSLFIQELINKDFEQLLFLLYKIDVAEKKVKEAILNSEPENAHIVIAQMIIDREKQKIETRKIYSSETDNSDWIF